MERLLRERVNENQVFFGLQASELHAFEPYRDRNARPTPGFYTDFSGVRTRLSYFPPLPGQYDQLVGDIPFPDDGVHAEAIEYLSAIKAVNAAGDSFTAIELGAGYGPWLTFCAKAAQQKGIKRIKLIAVEADSDRRALMNFHFPDNGLPPIDTGSTFSANESNGVSVESYLAAVGDENGKITFASAGALDWGGSVFVADESDEDHRGEKVQTREVDCVTIGHVMRNVAHVDFLHLDIQGYEYRAIEASLATIQSKVRFMLVETHSRIIEGNLISLLHGKGWRLINEKPCKGIYDPSRSPEATVQVDGSQLWVNVELVDSSKFDIYDAHYHLRVAQYRAEKLQEVVESKDRHIWALEAEIERLREKEAASQK